MAKQNLVEMTQDLVADGSLSQRDVDDILEAARKRSETQPVTREERRDIMKVVTTRMRGLSFDKLPLPLRILSIILIISSSLSIVGGIRILMGAVENGVFSQIEGTTISTAVVATIGMVTAAISTILSLVIGIRLLRGERGALSPLLTANMVLAALHGVCDIMLSGIGIELLLSLAALVIQIVVSAYLNPSLVQENNLRSGLRMLDTETQVRLGTLGLAEPGEGYIRLDFFNLFWVFMVGSFLGLVVEVIFHMIYIEPGVYQDRAGLLFGPFSPIYGFGAVLMTVFLNRFKDSSLIFIFVMCTIIGGAFEYFVSWFMEIAFGASAWDYSDQFLGDIFGGRTCLLYASMFGVLGLAWIKLLLGLLLKLINLIPWRLRYTVTGICAALMLVNGIMTLQALDNWSERLAGHQPATPVEQFYAEHFNNEYMASRFQSMSIDRNKSARPEA